ncbi:hypothetical protein ACJX0J_017202, partial [Zea mays]
NEKKNPQQKITLAGIPISNMDVNDGAARAQITRRIAQPTIADVSVDAHVVYLYLNYQSL